MQPTHFDDPMEVASRRKKYLRNNKFEDDNPETERIRRKNIGKVSLAPLNHTTQ